ncbi:MAG: hypothetical protein FJ279_06605 [Planctomycetes bacterium]|nr:hypothetical protein [Planctomycetota bacterium]
MDSRRLNTVLLSVAIVLLALLLLVELRGDRVAVAQSEGSAAHVIGLTGLPITQGTQQPIYIIDTRAQVLLVYEYRFNGQGLGLTGARSFKYDKEFLEFNPMEATQFQKSPSVEEVRKAVSGARR